MVFGNAEVVRWFFASGEIIEVFGREVGSIRPFDGIVFDLEKLELSKILQRFKDTPFERGLQVNNLRNVVIEPKFDAITRDVFCFNDFQKHGIHFN